MKQQQHLMRNVLWILVLAASHLAHVQSFDCAKAKTPQEKAICLSKESIAADDQMVVACRAALAAVPLDDLSSDFGKCREAFR